MKVGREGRLRIYLTCVRCGFLFEFFGGVFPKPAICKGCRKCER